MLLGASKYLHQGTNPGFPALSSRSWPAPSPPSLGAAQLHAPGSDEAMSNPPVELRAGNGDMHWVRLCALGGTLPRLQHAHMYPQNSANPDHQMWWENKIAEAAPGCLSVTPLRGPGHRLGKLPRRSKDKPSSLDFLNGRVFLAPGSWPPSPPAVSG